MNSKKPILALAPMADMTDSPFCRVCRLVNSESRQGEESLFNASKNVDNKATYKSIGKGSLPASSAGRDYQPFVVFREMVSAEAIVRNNERTLKMCEFDPIEAPIVMQLFGSNPEVIVKAAKIILSKGYFDSPFDSLRSPMVAQDIAGIDINMGCPVPKIIGKSNSGATLMRDHTRAVEIIKALKNANLGVPVSVKTRLGWAKDDEILEFAPKLEQAGADAISIHGRTKKQGYSGRANWERIREIKTKAKVKIPIIANGDIKSSADIQECLKVTGADGVMIGRRALGNPWIFRTPDFNLPAGEADNLTPDIDEVKRVVLRHAELHLEHYGEEFGLKTFRKHLALYFKGIVGMKELRMQLVKVNTLGELEEILFSNTLVRQKIN